MNYYPVIIPTLNRLVHFKRCVESLSKNTHANKTELVIGLDYPPSEKYVEGYKKVKEYISTISGFRKITVFERTENYGAERNFAELKKYAFEHYDALICSEDDNEFSPCFLDFMNKMLEHYKNDDRIVSVSAYLPFDYVDLTQSDIIFTKEVNAWGMGLWKKKEKSNVLTIENAVKIAKSFSASFKCCFSYPASFRMLLAMISNRDLWGDVIRTNMNIVNGQYQVRPSLSLCRNLGQDGSGLHCGIDERYKHQEISLNTVYTVANWNFSYSNKLKKLEFNHLLPTTFLRKVRFFVALAINYFLLRSHLHNSKKNK